MLKLYSSLLIFVSILNYGHTFNNRLLLTSDCPCSGYNLTFECTVIGVIGGSTRWNGDAIRQCPLPVFLRHREFIDGNTEPTVCNRGSLVIQSIGFESSCYTSQLTVLFNASLIGRTVTCSYDNGSVAINIGSLSISGNKKYYPPPTGIHLVSINQYQMTFAWNEVDHDSECSAIHYRIFALNCGTCLNNTRRNTTVCTNYRQTALGKICSFSVQTIFCDDATAGNMSEPIQVVLKVPAPPLVESIVHRYLNSTGDTIGFIVQFRTVASFIISDGIDGSAISYTLTYYNSISGIICGSAIVSASTCMDGVCRHTFTYEESACGSSSISVNVTISAANHLGSGPASDPIMVQGKANAFFNTVFDMVTNSIVCNFHDQMLVSDNKKLCRIDYGPEGESCSSYSQTSHGTSDMVRIGLPLQLSSSVQYCFTITGNNSTHTATVEGTFTPGIKIISQASCSVSLGLLLTVTVVFLLGVGIITALTIVIVFLVRSKRKIQVQLVKADTVNAPNPASTVPELKTTKTCIYEEVDSDHADGILDVENIAYQKKDFRRRCSTPCSDASKEDETYYTTI